MTSRPAIRGATALQRAGSEFRRRLVAVRDDHWALATPCDEWNVRVLVNHVIGGNFRYEMILNGEPPDTILGTHEKDWLARGSMTAFDEGLKRVTDAFTRPGILERQVHHPKSGSMTGAELRLLRVNELTVHAWDLAKSIDTDDHLDPEVVLWLVHRLEPLAPIISASGLYKALSTSPESTSSKSPQSRLLTLVGRRV